MVEATEVLVRESQRGNADAFTELILRYERAAWLVAWRVLRDHHLASDATQNAFVDAYKHLPQLRTPATFGSWMMRIVHRQAMRIASRIAKRVDKTVSLDPRVDLEEPATPNDDDNQLLLAIAELPEHEQMVVVLRYFNGLSVADIARDRNSPIGTVTKQLSRAIARLKTLIQENVQ